MICIPGNIFNHNSFLYCINQPTNNIDFFGYASHKTFWWGYEFYLSKKQANKLITALSTIRNVTALITSLNSVLPEPIFSKSIALALWTFSTTLGAIATLIKKQNSGKNGVKLKFVWPFVFVGVNKR